MRDCYFFSGRICYVFLGSCFRNALIGILLLVRGRSSVCANFGKMEDLLEGSLRSKEKYGHINHKEEIYEFKFQNQHNFTSLPLGLSLYTSCFCFLLCIYFLSLQNTYFNIVKTQVLTAFSFYILQFTSQKEDKLPFLNAI